MTMAANQQAHLCDFLVTARDHGLPSGWLYLRGPGGIGLETPCLLVGDREMDLDDRGLAVVAVASGFEIPGLDSGTLQEVVDWSRQFQDPPSSSLMLESFLWYLRHDAFLPYPGAPPPPPADEIRLTLDRKFLDELGPERAGTLCAHPGCHRGTVSLSVMCRVHHFEMIHKRKCPLDG